MNAREFAYWIAYDRIQPFGSAREDHRAGTIAAAFVNMHIKPGRKHLNWLDFFPSYKVNEPLDWQELLTKVTTINAELGGSDIRNTKLAD